MMRALEMLSKLPGVRHVMLVTEDGVPVAVSGMNSGRSDDASSDIDLPSDEVPELGTEDALAGLAVGFLTDLTLAVGQMSWNGPRRVILRGARGTLIMQTMRGSVLMVLLAAGLRAEELRLSMDGTVARIERTLRDMGGVGPIGDANDTARGADREMETPGPLPSTKDGEGAGSGMEAATEHGESGSPQ